MKEIEIEGKKIRLTVPKMKEVKRGALKVVEFFLSPERKARLKKFLRSWLKNQLGLAYRELSWEDVFNITSNACPEADIWCFDRKYWATTKEGFLRCIKLEFVDERMYKMELFDCDNYAWIFKGHMSYDFDITSVGFAIGEVRDEKGNLLGYHAWNTVIVIENGALKFYHFEPQADMLSENGTFGRYRYIPYLIQY